MNRAVNVFEEAEASGERPWDVDRHPGARLGWLFALIALAVVVVAGRLVYLQAFISHRFEVGVDQTTVSYESIPSRDGRILASDGRVLAYDEQRFDVLMHYRWLEEPADSEWLRQQALARLGSDEERSAERVEAEEKKVLELRRGMWRRLAGLTETDREALEAARARVQRRVERIVESVKRRHREALEEERSRRPLTPALSPGGRGRIGKPLTPALSPPGRGSLGWLRRLWETVVLTLTVPPERGPRRPVLPVKEELDYHPVLEDVSLEAAGEIESHPELYPGLRVRVSTTRRTPTGSLAAHVIGSRVPVGHDELEERRERFPQGDPLDYRLGDRIGVTGVERAYDQRLHGLRGLRKIVTNGQGEVIRSEVVREPRIGRDVVLTLDLALQEKVEELLDRALAERADQSGRGRDSAGAAAVVLDVHSGAVLAAVSAPRYDLRSMGEGEEWEAVLADPRRPLFHRAIRMALPPGSVFKALTATAVLESGAVDPEAGIHCQGYLNRPDRFRCWISRYGYGHGDLDLSGALCRSCNVYFYKVGRRTGPEPMVRWARRFGFGRPTGIDLPGESGGHLPTPEGQRWYGGTTMQLAIGQASLTATPLQVARMMAAVANGGKLVTPYVAEPAGPRFADGPWSGFPERREPERIAGLSAETLRRVREGLWRVVNDPEGTAHRWVHREDVEIAGKTGTAQAGRGMEDHAWFAGYVPADRPQVALAVVLEHAGSGGRNAGPVAREVVEVLLELGVVEGDGAMR